jgi:hypothetical protein
MSAEVRTEVRVERGLASAYRLRPPLCVAPRFRDETRGEVRDKEIELLRIYLWSKSN